jgi:hypothetical protein
LFLRPAWTFENTHDEPDAFVFTTRWFESLSIARRPSRLPPVIYPLRPASRQATSAPVVEPPRSEPLVDELPKRRAVVEQDSLSERNVIGYEAIRAALAGIAVELEDSDLEERKPRWKLALAAVGALAAVAVGGDVVWRTQTAEHQVVRAVVPQVPAANVDTARAVTLHVEEIATPPGPSVAPVPSAAPVPSVAPVRSVSPAKSRPTKRAPERAYVAAIAVEPTKVRVAVAKRVALTVAVIGEDGSDIDGRTVSWTSSRKRVATVSSKGVVTGRGVGTAKITATSGDKRSSIVVTVTARGNGEG